MILESSISMLSAVNLHLHCDIQCLMGPQRLVEIPTKTLILDNRFVMEVGKAVQSERAAEF